MSSTDARGTFPDRNTFRLETRYPHPPDRVWQAITDPEHLAVWFMPMQIDLRVGGRVLLVDYGQEGKSPPAEGVVTACEPGSLLEYRFDKGEWDWPESTLRYELSVDGDGCRLVFSQTVAPDTVWAVDPEGQVGGPGTIHPGACAGWEGFFEEGLSRFLAGRRAPLYDEDDDRLMDARTAAYRPRLEALAP